MNHPAFPLRERRRRQTARDIQHATLDLVRRHGYSHVTTEMIADAAGISLRTFFNYYPNKETALVGPPARIDEGAVAKIATADGPLVEDFASLIRAELELNTSRKQSIRAIDEVIRANPGLETAFGRSLSPLRVQLASALTERIGAAGPAADILADVLTKALARAFRDWAHDEEMSLDEAVRNMAEQLHTVGHSLRS